MERDGHMLCASMALFSQFAHLIVLKFLQHQYVTILFNLSDQDTNMNVTKSNGHQTIYYV